MRVVIQESGYLGLFEKLLVPGFSCKNDNMWIVFFDTKGFKY